MADEDRVPRQSELFTVRLWPEDLGAGQTEWRGRVQHAISGEARYFREWSGLIAFLGEVLASGEVKSSLETET